jgi:glucose 1-dehydrogenase
MLRLRNFGSVDIVIANAGITLFGDFLEYKTEDFYNVMKVNLGGSFFLAQFGLPDK